MKNLRRIIALMSATVVTATVLGSCSLRSISDRETVSIEKKQVEKVERLPGIAIWGGSMAYGAYGEGTTITKSVENHMMSDECYIPIANMAVPLESTKTVMSRAGAIDIYTEAFTIPATIEKVQIKIYSADGSDVFPLRYSTRWDGGMTDISIAGIEGSLTIDENSISFEKPIYYFTRSKEGEEVKVEKGEKIISKSMTDYVDYIPVVCIGDNGGWESFDELIEQQQAIIDTSTNSDKYVVVGLFTVPLTEEQLKSVSNDEEKAELIKKNNENYDKIMKEKWGDHYVNAREYLCSNVALEKLENQEVEVSDEDKVNMSKGIVPDVLRYDPNNLNSYGYDIVGDALYQKLVDLGYLYN